MSREKKKMLLLRGSKVISNLLETDDRAGTDKTGPSYGRVQKHFSGMLQTRALVSDIWRSGLVCLDPQRHPMAIVRGRS